ncbi:MAG TPA: amino acid permease [Thermoplasmata archaeon]|nr:amino acid permease [Thermoplasmata archaeon]
MEAQGNGPGPADVAQAETSVFARKSSGLVKELGALQSFSINLISLGPGPAFGLFFVILVLVPGVNLLYATLLAGLIAVPIVITYTVMAVEVPRSGGEYVYASRLMHPYFGLVSGLSRVVNVIIYAGVLPYWFIWLAVGPALASWGALANHPALFNLGNNWSLVNTGLLSGADNATAQFQVMVIGEILTAVIAVLWIAMKPRLAFNVFTALLFIEVLGLITTVVALLALGHAGFVSTVNSYMAANGYSGSFYQDVSAYGASLGAYGSNLGNTLTFVPLVFAFYFMFTTAPNYIAGEFRRTGRSVRLGMAVSFLLAVVFSVAVILVFENVVGMDFLNGLSAGLYPAVFTTPPPGFLPFSPGFATLPMFAAHGSDIVMGLIFLGAASWYLLWIVLGLYIFSRYVLSFSLDRLLPRQMSAVLRSTHQPYAGIIAVSVAGLVLFPIVTYYYASVYAPLVYLLFFLPMVSVTLTSISLLLHGRKVHRPGFMVAGGVSAAITAVAAYLVSTLPDLGGAAGFTLSNQTTSYVTIAAVFVGSAVWYVVLRWLNRQRRGIDIALAFKELPPD